MKLLKGEEILLKNKDFKLVNEKENYFFVHKCGQKVLTDKLGKTIWESLPGKASEIKEKIKKEFVVSDKLIRDFLYVLLKANLIESSMRKNSSLLSKNNMRQEDLISVIVVTRNSEEHIKECLQSIINQSYKNLETIVVDNASEDKTVDIIKNLFPQVKIYDLKKNIYYPGAVNYGIKKAKGKYFLILNDDVELDRDCISFLYYKIKKNKKIGAVVPMMKFYYLRGFINGIGNQVRNYGWGTDNFIGHVDIGQFSDLKEVPSACFGAVFLNKDAVKEVGLLDEKYIAYYEDVDWSFRCWLKGWKIIPAIKAIVYHKFGAYWKTMEKKLKFVARNRLRLVLKIFQGKIMFGFLKRYLREDIKNILSLIKKRNYVYIREYIKAYFSLFLSLPDIFIKRRKLMKSKLKNVMERDILVKNPSFYTCVNENGIPIIDCGVIFGYYKWEIEKLKFQNSNAKIQNKFKKTGRLKGRNEI